MTMGQTTITPFRLTWFKPFNVFLYVSIEGVMCEFINLLTEPLMMDSSMVFTKKKQLFRQEKNTSPGKPEIPWKLPLCCVTTPENHSVLAVDPDGTIHTKPIRHQRVSTGGLITETTEEEVRGQSNHRALAPPGIHPHRFLHHFLFPLFFNESANPPC